MNSTSSKGGSNIQSLISALVIPLSIVIGFVIWKFVLGDPSGFEGGDTEKNPLQGNILAMMYKGGYIVPVLIGTFITTITFSIERFISINKSKGSGSIETFIHNIRSLMAKGDIAGAKAACAKQRGSIANVVNAGLNAYSNMQNERNMDKEQKMATIQKELEEATTLELPMLLKKPGNHLYYCFYRNTPRSVRNGTRDDSRVRCSCNSGRSGCCSAFYRYL